MPVEPSSIASAIIASAPFPRGPTYGLVALGVGNAITSWILGGFANFSLSGVTTGSAGVGVVNGKLTFPPSVGVVSASMVSAGLRGPTVPLLAQGVSIGVSTALSSTALYAGVSSGVSVGTDSSIVSISNALTLIQILQANFTATFASSGGLPSGIGIISLSQGLGTGLSGQCQLATGVGIVSGGPLPTTTIGTSISTVV